MKKLLAAFFGTAVFTFSSHSQIVNIESSRMQSDTVGWMGGASAAVSLAQNTQKIFGVDLESHLQYKTSNDRGLWLILGDYNFLKAGNDELFSNIFTHLRYNRKINEWLRWEIFGQFQNNMITQIDSRVLVGTGPRFKLVKTKILRLYTATLFMYEREKEKTTPVVKHEDLRSSSYISLTWTPMENIELISTAFFQPKFNNFSDYRLLHHLTFKVSATKHFALSVKWQYLHDRFPAGSAPRTTYKFSTGFDYELPKKKKSVN